MKFGPVPLAEAEGAILAHGVPSASLSKGCVLGLGHLQSLKAQGVKDVVVARLEAGDVGEDDAATRIAQALVPDGAAQGIRLTPAKAGRVNLVAQRAGLFDIDVDKVTAMNCIDPMITLATLPPLQRVSAGVMLATVKIISYGVGEGQLALACDAVVGRALGIRTAEITTATLIETHHPGAGHAPKARRVLDERLDRLGATLIETLDVPHAVDAIAQALDQAKGGIVFVLTASATSDINDTAPAALVRAGGQMVHLGMPVDPGNLLFVGQTRQGRPVIGLPGCARSPALNGADWVMERIICGIPTGPRDIAAMGVGGLLKEIPERGRPRHTPLVPAH